MLSYQSRVVAYLFLSGYKKCEVGFWPHTHTVHFLLDSIFPDTFCCSCCCCCFCCCCCCCCCCCTFTLFSSIVRAANVVTFWKLPTARWLFHVTYFHWWRQYEKWLKLSCHIPFGQPIQVLTKRMQSKRRCGLNWL